MSDKLTNYVEVIASVTMSKSLCIEVPEGATKEDIIELAKRELILPHKGIAYLENILSQVGVQINGIEHIKDWNIDELKYITDYESEQLIDNNRSDSSSEHPNTEE